MNKLGLAFKEMLLKQHPELEKEIREPSKYSNQLWELDGIVFQSKLEARRWQELCLLVKAGFVRNLDRQVPFPIVVNDVKVTTYYSDFRYEEMDEKNEWHPVVEDTKGFRTEVYKLKRKLMIACHGIAIRETTADSVRAQRQP